MVTDSGETLRVCRHLWQVYARVRSTCVGADSLHGGLFSDTVNTCTSAITVRGPNGYFYISGWRHYILDEKHGK